MSPALDRSIPTLGRIFAAAGYETAYFGKWHLGGTPGDYGFESHDSTIDDPTLARRVVGFVQKRAANEARRPLFLVVSWITPTTSTTSSLRLRRTRERWRPRGSRQT